MQKNTCLDVVAGGPRLPTRKENQILKFTQPGRHVEVRWVGWVGLLPSIRRLARVREEGIGPAGRGGCLINRRLDAPGRLALRACAPRAFRADEIEPLLVARHAHDENAAPLGTLRRAWCGAGDRSFVG